MLIKESYVDVPTKASGQDGSMRIYVFHPTVPGYPNARFPGVVVFSEIYQVTGPVARFARQIAGQGYICVAPSSYHEFTGPEALNYDAEDTDKGNLWKISKKVAAYDEDASLSVDYLLSLPTCNGRIGATGMCLGGHLAYRCALDQRVKAAVCYFATDIHSATLGEGKKDDSLARAGDIKGELAMIFGKNDNHVPPEGRDLIRKTLHEKGVLFSFYEVAWAQHAFIRDELSKGRYDPAISKTCFEMLLELFGRTLKLDLGDHDGKEIKIENEDDPLAEEEEILSRQADPLYQRDQFRIQRGPRIVYLSIYGFDVLPSQQGSDPGEILQELNDLVPIWRRTDWRTAVLSKNTVTGEIECQTDLVAPHCMDRDVLRTLELCPLYINVLDLIEVKRLKDRVSRVALLQEPSNIPVFMVMKMASFARDVGAMQREAEVYAHLFDLGANNLAPEFLGFVYEEHEHRVVGFLMEDYEGRCANAEDLDDCLDVVKDLHQVGVLHGDLRPSNFIINEDFGVRMIDFESAVIYPLEQEIPQEKKEEEIRQLETLLLGSPGPSVA